MNEDSVNRNTSDTELSKMAYWIMCRAIERDPNSSWAKEATEQWLRYCERETHAINQIGDCK